jgi:hypothetical protein
MAIPASGGRGGDLSLSAPVRSAISQYATAE